MLAHLLIDGAAGAAIIGLAVSLHRFLREPTSGSLGSCSERGSPPA